MRSRIHLFLAFSVAFASVAARVAHAQQTRDRVSFTADVLPTAAIARVPADPTGEASAAAVELNANHRFALADSGNDLLTVGLMVRNVWLDSPGLRPAAAASRGIAVMQAIPQLTYMRVLSESTSIVVNLRPGFFGATESVGALRGDTFRLEGGLVVSHVLDEHWTLGWGVARGSNLGRVLVVPVAQVLWFPSDQWMIDALLPIRADVWWLPDSEWEVGLQLALAGSQYAMAGAGEVNFEELRFAQIQISAGVRRRVLDKTYVQVDLGRTVSRRFETWAAGQLLRDFAPAQAWFARTGLTWRF